MLPLLFVSYDVSMENVLRDISEIVCFVIVLCTSYCLCELWFWPLSCHALPCVPS